MGTQGSGLRAGESGQSLDKPESGRTFNRRTLLAVAGGTVAAGLGAPFPKSAEGAPEITRSAGRIDAYTHFSSMKYIDALEKQAGKSFALNSRYGHRPSLFDPKARLDLLDRNEVDVHVLVPIPWLEVFPSVAADRAVAPQMAKLINDEIAAVIANQPQRFRGVALLPSVDPEAMVAELHRCVKELGFLGAFMPVGPTVKPMDHPDMEFLYRAIVELDATLWLHPSRPPLPEYNNGANPNYQEWIAIGWPDDTTAAMYRIVLSGVFDRYPTIRIVTHHHGGFVPYYAPRMAGIWLEEEDSGRSADTKISKPYIDHFRKFYCDTACNEFAPKALELALDFFGSERVFFGSDVPFGANDGQRYTTEVLRSIESMTITPDVRKSVLHGNARRVFKIT